MPVSSRAMRLLAAHVRVSGAPRQDILDFSARTTVTRARVDPGAGASVGDDRRVAPRGRRLVWWWVSPARTVVCSVGSYVRVQMILGDSHIMLQRQELGGEQRIWTGL